MKLFDVGKVFKKRLLSGRRSKRKARPLEKMMMVAPMVRKRRTRRRDRGAVQARLFQKQWRKDARIYEYGSANPDMKPIPVLVHPPIGTNEARRELFRSISTIF